MIRVRILPGDAVGVKVKTEIVQVGSLPVYAGPYTFTPSEQSQTALTANKELSQNIIINPIPSNYGKITYNGFTIRVS